MHIDRRRFLYDTMLGAGPLALASMLQGAGASPHHAAKAKSCIFLTMLGGVSQMDTFDPKPALDKFDNTVMDWSKERATDQANLFSKPRLILRSPWKFAKHGRCGMDVSELFPNLATCVDDMAFVRSIQAENGNHPAAVFLMNTGTVMPGSPSVGAWCSFGLGADNRNLPGFVVLPDFRALPFSGSQQWGAGFLPAAYQGTLLRWKGEPVRDLQPPAGVSASSQAAEMSLLHEWNQAHASGHFTNPDLQGRIDAYELAYRMQAEVPGTLDIENEPVQVREMYGLDSEVTESFGRRCLMARRLVEKGVRFVQLYTPSQSWDSHTELLGRHKKNADEVDRPIAALIHDLKRRGLLDTTLIVWMGEFGRTPDNLADQRDKAGRDHNTRAMTVFFAGGGVRGGACVGRTDDLGFKAVENIYRIRDVHATILHLMGLNDMRLTHYHAGRNRRLTDLGGNPIKEIFA
jgi:hypothetical protein